jgi:hypothetical protein
MAARDKRKTQVVKHNIPIKYEKKANSRKVFDNDKKNRGKDNM